MAHTASLLHSQPPLNLICYFQCGNLPYRAHIYYRYIHFPLDTLRHFKKKQQVKSKNIVRLVFQFLMWLYVFLIIGILCGYLALVLTWFSSRGHSQPSGLSLLRHLLYHARYVYDSQGQRVESNTESRYRVSHGSHEMEG